MNATGSRKTVVISQPSTQFHSTRAAAVYLFIWLALHGSVSGQTAQWIWPSKTRTTDMAASWRKSIEARASVQQALLSGIADFCNLSVRLNGHEVATCEGLEVSGPFIADVTPWIRTGSNSLELRATSDSGPAAVALRLEITPVEGPRETIVTDKSWPSSLGDNDRNPSVELGEVREFELDPQRQFGITALDDYEQWRQALQTDQGANPSSFLIAPGFQIELVRSAGKDEGSWVSMAFDPQGRLVIGREDRGLLRMTLAADKRSIARVETVNDSLLECRGLQFVQGTLYANANNSKGFYRLRDTDGDDQFDEVQLLREFPGGVGHGRNDLTLGPDGMLYLIHGDSVDLPSDCEDWTSPFREHRRGQKTQEGYLIRTDLDGRRWQLLSAGLRNPYGIAFNSDGEAFTYDADAEFDMGSPWYRPTQVKHLVAGSDFGWRGVTGRWPPYYPDHPDNAQPSAHIGKGSPTSVKFGYESQFPSPYREALFILDWAYGRIIAVHLTPRGAGYVGRPETFLKGRPLNVTDLDFGPDGAMYFVTGGRKTQAGLYRVHYSGPSAPAVIPTTQQHARGEHSRVARALRKKLEGLLIHQGESAAALDAAWPHLDSPDPSLRHAARMAVERQPVSDWQDRALDEPRMTARLTALLALARNNDAAATSRIVKNLNTISIDRLNNAQKIAALYLYQLSLGDEDGMDASLRKEAVSRLDAVYPDSSPAANRYLSLLLASEHSPYVVSKTIPLLLASTDQAEQLHYLFAIRKVTEGWTPARRQSYIDGLRRSAAYLGGEGMPGFLKQIRSDALAAMPETEREPFAAQTDPAVAPPAEAIPQRPLVRHWAMPDVEDLATAANGSRDWARGRQLFTAALCARCHRVGDHGFLAGPDLTGVSRRFTRRDILQSVVSPSLVVAENYHSDRVVTADGRVVVGRIVQSGDFRSTTLRIVVDPLRPDQYTEVAKRDVESHATVPTSPMPAGLLDTLTKDEIADLLAFIESGGVAP